MHAKRQVEENRRGISPDQARADFLAREIEAIRDAIEATRGEEKDVTKVLSRIRGVLDRIPHQR